MGTITDTGIYYTNTISNQREREMFYLTTHSTHFIYGYMVSDIWLRTILIVRKETRCCHIGYSYRLTARVLLYAPTHRQDNTYHSLCYTSRGALAGTRNISQIKSQEFISHIKQHFMTKSHLTCHQCHSRFGHAVSKVAYTYNLLIKTVA